MSGRRTRPGDLARARKAVNKPRAQVPALRKERFLAAQEKRGLLKGGVEATQVFEDLARHGGHLVLPINGRDPDEVHREKLLATFHTVATVLKATDLPRASRQGLRVILMDIRDCLDGCHPKVLAPIRKGPGRRHDPLRDWWARADLAIMAERVKRMLPENERDEFAAYRAFLPRVDVELRRFGFEVGDALPGQKAKKSEGAADDQSRRAEIAERSDKMEAVISRCVGHKADLDGGSGTIPQTALTYFQTKLAELDQIERAGALTRISDDEIFDVCLDLRLSFDRDDHDKLYESLTPP